MDQDKRLPIVTPWGKRVSIRAGDHVELAGLPRTWFKLVHISESIRSDVSPEIDLVDPQGREYRSIADTIVEVRQAA